MIEAFICDAVRTPIGRVGGALSHTRADDLAALPLKALVERNRAVDWDAVDDVVFGCANQAGEDNRNVARMALLLAGLPVRLPGSTTNRLCASGLDAVGSAARAIRANDADLLIAGGVESMSRAPFVMAKADTAFSRTQNLEDTTIGWRLVNPALRATYGVDSMPQTAENVAQQWQVSREDQDRFALHSQQKAAAAQQSGRLAVEISPVPVQKAKQSTLFVQDEHPRASTLEGLAALKPVVRPGGSVTAGNAAGINDGSAAMLIASEQAAARHGLTPRARIVAMAAAGVEPRFMGIGPVPAVQKLAARTGVGTEQIDVIELNEAFAAQAIAVLRELGVDPHDERVNRNGGAIVLGHPLGMSGARLAMTAAEELHRVGGRHALATMCVGVGQGLAVLLERV